MTDDDWAQLEPLIIARRAAEDRYHTALIERVRFPYAETEAQYLEFCRASIELKASQHAVSLMEIKLGLV